MMSRFSPEPRSHRHGSLFGGGALILAGTALLLSHLGYLGGMNPWHLWPCLLIWAGGLKLAGLHHHGNRAGGAVLILVGALLQANYLHLLPVDTASLWPVALIAVGLYILLRGGRRHTCHVGGTMSTEPTLTRSVLFSGSQERITNQRFQGGTIQAVAGGLQLDFTGAEIEGEEAVLDVDVSMGGLELRVPRHWKVLVEAKVMLGGIEDRTRLDETAPAIKRLKLTGRVLMGGVEIKN